MLKIVILIISIISLLNAVEGQSKPNYVNLCDFQNIGSAARHQCQGVTEIRIQEQSSQNENFWCFLLDNRNGQYTNQILKFGFIGGMNQMAQVCDFYVFIFFIDCYSYILVFFEG